MRILFVALILVVSVQILNGQGILSSNPIWHVREIQSGWSPETEKRSVLFRVGRKDKVGKKEYYVIEKSSAHDTVWSETEIRYRESGDTIFSLEFGEEFIFLIHNVDLGATYKQYNCDITIEQLDKIESLGRQHETYRLSHGRGYGTQINRIGLLKQTFSPGLCTADYPSQSLRCYETKGEMVFQVNDGLPCSLPDSIITSVSIENKGIEPTGIVTNDRKVKLSDEILDYCELVTLDGRRQGHHVSGGYIIIESPGIYFVFYKLQGKQEQRVKLVNYVP